MKTLLVPVDFSAVPKNAFLFATELGMWASAPLIVMNILQSRLRASDQNSIRGMASHTHLPLLIMHEAEG